MLFKSLLIANGSGSYGGITLSRNRAGMYFRSRVVPTDPGSGNQVFVRNVFGNLATAWLTLTPAQRDAWTQYAINVPITGKLGDPLTLTGQQMFIRCNAARMRAGFAQVDDGPTTYSMDALSPVVISASASVQLFSIVFDVNDDWVDEDDAALLVYGSREKSPSVNFFKGPYLLAGSVDGDNLSPPTSPDTSLNTPYTVTAGSALFTRVLSIRADGRISPVQRERLIVDV